MVKILVIGDFHGKFPSGLKKEAKNVDFIISLGDYYGMSGWDDYLIEMFKSFKNNTGYLLPEKYYGEKKYERLEKNAYVNMKKILLDLSNLRRPVYTIMGNYDYSLYKFPFEKNIVSDDQKDFTKWFKDLKSIKSFNYRIKKINGVEFLGFGGYMDDEFHLPNRNKKNLNDREVERLKRFDKTKKKFFNLVSKMKYRGIFVLHYPPSGKFGKVADKRNPYVGEDVGIRFFRDAIKKERPYFVLCGHMHEHQGMVKMYGVPVISVGCASEGKGCVVDFDFEKRKLVDVKFIK